MCSLSMETITITFGDVAENHVGMEQIGHKRTFGFFGEDLRCVRDDMIAKGYQVELIDLVEASGSSLSLEEASVLVIRNGLEVFAQGDLMEEMRSLDWDTKMYNKRRNLVQDKIARHNLCFADFSSEPDYEKGKGRVYNFEDLPVLKEIRENLSDVFGYTAHNLVAEGNRYYDVKKCGIGFHGDTERHVVIGFRLGADFPLEYQWYHKSNPVGERIRIELKDKDVYAMSQKAVGSDWKKSSKYTLRHAAGFHKRFMRPVE